MDVISTASEYLVKLGVQMDTSDIAKFEAFMKSGKVQAAALGTALVALGKATYNFLKTQVDYEKELESLAGKQKSALANTRAEQNALKAMGKTLSEINKDSDLKKIYDDLVKIGKETPMPDFSGVMKQINQLQASFYGLKYEIQYTMQWISYYVLEEFNGPIKEITNVFNQLKDWLKANMQSVARNIGIVIGDLGRGITAIFQTISQAAQLIGQIPDSVKLITAAFAILNSGPLGVLLSGLTLIGDLVKDYENYEWKKENAGTETAETDEYKELQIALPEIWEAIDGVESIPEKLEAGIGSLQTLLFGEDGDLFTFITKFLESDEGAELKAFGSRLFGYIVDGIRETDHAAAQVVGALFGAVVGNDSEVAAAIKNNEVWGVVGTAVVQKMFGVDDKTILIDSLIQLFTVDTSNETLVKKLADFGSNVWGLITDGLINADKGIGDLMTELAEYLTGENEDTNPLMAALNNNSEVYAGIGTTILSFVLGGFKGGLITGLAQILAGIQQGDVLQGILDNGELIDLGNQSVGDWVGDNQIVGTTKTSFLDRIVKAFTDLGPAIQEAIENVKKYFTSGEGKTAWNDLTEAFSNLWNDLTAEDGILSNFSTFGSDIVEAIAGEFGNLWDKIEPYFQVVAMNLEAWFANTPLGKALQAVGLGSSGGTGNKVVKNKNGEYVQLSQITAGEGESLFDAQVEAIKASQNDPVAQALNNYAFSDEIGDERLSRMYQYYLSNGNVEGMQDVTGIQSAYATTMGFNPGASKTYQDAYSQQALALFLQRQYEGSVEGGTSEEDAAEVSAAAAEELGYSATDIKEAAQSLTSASSTMAEAIVTAASKLGSSSGATDTQEAWGGRIGEETNNLTVGEDGPEYIIPITKPKRAAQLIKQMVTEMGSSAASTLMDALGISTDTSTIGGSLSSGISGMTSPVINYYNTVNANTTINVTGNGDAKDIGTAAYNAHERYLVRTLQGVFA